MSESMKMKMKMLLMILGAAFVAAPTCVLALGVPKLIQISTLPFTISAPGTYVFTRDLSWFDPSGQVAAITIQSPAANGFAGPVILDLNGHTLTGEPQGVVGFETGIAVVQSGLPTAFTITVTNGTIANYAYGVGARSPVRRAFASSIYLNNLSISGTGTCISLGFVESSVISNCQFISSGTAISAADCGAGNHFINNRFTGVFTDLNIIEQAYGVMTDCSWAPKTN
jgi:hypothetical protein